MFGSQYAMRVWLNPDRLTSLSLTPADVTAAIQSQNVQVPVGQIGANPAMPGQELNVIMQGRTTLTSVEEFENILVRMNPDGSRVLLYLPAAVASAGVFDREFQPHVLPASSLQRLLSVYWTILWRVNQPSPQRHC